MNALKKLYLQNKLNQDIFNSNIPILFFIMLLTGLVVYPLLILFFNSFGISSLKSIEFDLAAYVKFFSAPQTVNAFINTVYLALGVVIMASLFGGGLAWLVTRTDFPFKKGITKLVLLTHIIPSYIMAIAWIELLGRNGVIKELGFSSIPINIYSLEGVIFVMSLHLYPLVYTALANALNKTDLSLEKAAFMSGASRFKILRTITFPLIKPSIFSINLFILAKTISCFGVAAILALPARKYVLTTYIYTALNSLDFKLATAISVILVLFSGAVFLLQNNILKRKNYTLLKTNTSCSELIALGRYKRPLTLLVGVFFLITVILPLLIIFLVSLLKCWGRGFKGTNFTFNNYIEILFKKDLTVRAIKNSVCYGMISATVAVIIGAIASCISNRSNFKAKGVVEFLASWPMAVPTTVMAIGAILAWINTPLKFYNTPWIIIITYIAVSLPLVVRNVSGLIQNIDIDLEKMARISGASYLRTYWDITIPLIKPGLKTGWILSFLFALREIPISVMLYASGTETIGVLLFNLRSDTGGLETISTVAVIVIVLTIVGQFLIDKFNKVKR